MRRQQQTGQRGGADEVQNEEEWWKSDDSESTSDEEDMQPGTSEDHANWLFDPGADSRDEAWMQKKRGGRPSDAILSCPGCLTTLCLDCQQHTQYLHQFRAMFVLNCTVVEGQPKAWESIPTVGRKRGPSAEASAPPPSGQQQATSAQVVKCAVCNLEVGIQDSDEIFHFYNVMPSNA